MPIPSTIARDDEAVEHPAKGKRKGTSGKVNSRSTKPKKSKKKAPSMIEAQGMPLADLLTVDTVALATHRLIAAVTANTTLRTALMSRVSSQPRKLSSAFSSVSINLSKTQASAQVCARAEQASPLQRPGCCPCSPLATCLSRSAQEAYDSARQLDENLQAIDRQLQQFLLDDFIPQITVPPTTPPPSAVA